MLSNPVEPHTSRSEHVPQFCTPPQPSAMRPQVAPNSAQTTLIQLPDSGVLMASKGQPDIPVATVSQKRIRYRPFTVPHPTRELSRLLPPPFGWRPRFATLTRRAVRGKTEAMAPFSGRKGSVSRLSSNWGCARGRGGGTALTQPTEKYRDRRRLQEHPPVAKD
jgi:hypothetical protein